MDAIRLQGQRGSERAAGGAAATIQISLLKLTGRTPDPLVMVGPLRVLIAISVLVLVSVHSGSILRLITAPVASGGDALSVPTSTPSPSPCAQPFGTDCGRDLRGIIGYSNCNSDTVSNIESWVEVDGVGSVYAGMKWQCVEYSRRWLIQHRRVTFACVQLVLRANSFLLTRILKYFHWSR